MLLGGPPVVLGGNVAVPPPPLLATDMGQVPLPRNILFDHTKMWYKLIPAGATVQARSAEWVAGLCTQMDLDPATGLPVAGASGARAQIDGAIPCYVVPADAPRVPVRVRAEVGLQPPVYGLASAELDARLRRGVPIPTDWVSGPSGDHYVNIVQPSTGEAWELFTVYPDPTYGVTCGWGGYVDNLAQHRGFYGDRYNAQGALIEGVYWGPAASGISLLGGILDLEEVMAGECHHALQMSVGWSGMPWQWPAQRSDGQWVTGYPPEGGLWRFPADIDVDQALTRFHTGSVLTTTERTRALAFMRLLIETIRDYGIYAVDQTGFGVALQLRQYAAQTGWQHGWETYLPWYPKVNLAEYMWALPWHRAQVINPIA